jgi:predicted P-loop ATPase
VSKEDAVEIVVDLAMDNSYSPVVKYLDSLSYQGKQSPEEFLDGLAFSYFGASSSIHAALFKRTLIAAVARAYEPGCKVDTISILQGRQGALKSTFWKGLAGKDFFTDDISSGTEKDEVMKISQYWFLEYSEFETAYKKKEVSQLKAFLSRPFDSIRMPYGRDIQDFYRPSVFVGTTNKTEFLHDPTGERRYWVIPVSKKIDIAKLQKERDQVWAAAVECYRSGVFCYLNDQEEEALKSASEVFQSSSIWQQPIEEYLAGRAWTTPKHILTECLNFDLNRIEPKHERTVTEILRLLQWDKSPNQKRIVGLRIRVWEPLNQIQPETAARQASNPYPVRDTEIFDDVSPLASETAVRQGSETGLTPYTASTSELVSQVSQQISENFSNKNQNDDDYVRLNSQEVLEKLNSQEVLEKNSETPETGNETLTTQATQGVSVSVSGVSPTKSSQSEKGDRTSQTATSPKVGDVGTFTVKKYRGGNDVISGTLTISPNKGFHGETMYCCVHPDGGYSNDFHLRDVVAVTGYVPDADLDF